MCLLLPRCVPSVLTSRQGVDSRLANLQRLPLPSQIDHIHIIKTTELTAAVLGPEGTVRSHVAAEALFRTMPRRASLDQTGNRCTSTA